ncbi:hypothetical protein L3X38_024838 [Prunus dulcis]|uniref:Uncharacterized protein n=1 Tax=Prunus dulcis TaxID=3755 RepID=A0AAD4Z6I7_PRUDU|nr:hypothetical protein L3X38_024838 [Prunus dulcis]
MRNFNKFIDDCEVVLLAATGVPFTWCNGHHDNTIIYERLDRALANPDWMRLLPHSELQNLHIMRSDHGPIFLKCNQISRRIPKAFKFEAMWLAHKDFDQVVSQVWNCSHGGNAAQQIQICCDILPEVVQAFKLRFTAEQPPHHHLMMDFLRVIEPCVTSLDNENLLAPVSNLELECALKSIGPLKAPGLDGLQAIFYQKCWDKTKHLIKFLVNDFLSDNISLQDINHTNIALIPKVASPESVNHFRSSLCNVSLLVEFVKEIPYPLTFLFFAWNLL